MHEMILWWSTIEFEEKSHRLLTHRWRHPSSTKGFLRCVLHSVCPHPVCMLAYPKKSAPRTFPVFPDRGCRLPRLVVEASLGPSIVFAIFFWKFRSAPPRWPRNSTRSRRSADWCYYPRLAGRVDIAALFNQFGMDCDEVVFFGREAKIRTFAGSLSPARADGHRRTLWMCCQL